MYSLFMTGWKIGPRLLARIAKATGLRPEDLFMTGLKGVMFSLG